MNKGNIDQQLDDALDKLWDKGYACGNLVGKVLGENDGKILGIAEGQTETILTVLRARFKKVPKRVAISIRQMTDPTALDSCAVQAATCQSMGEFVEALK
jgi:hypothetical protein